MAARDRTAENAPFALDRIKYGGPRKKKKACMLRKCANMDLIVLQIFYCGMWSAMYNRDLSAMALGLSTKSQ
jgi:hypothetical protein